MFHTAKDDEDDGKVEADKLKTAMFTTAIAMHSPRDIRRVAAKIDGEGDDKNMTQADLLEKALLEDPWFMDVPPEIPAEIAAMFGADAGLEGA